MSQKELRRMLSKLGIASRKAAEGIIISGRVRVNGHVVKDPLQPVGLSDAILLDNAPVAVKRMVIYACNKPRGVVTTMAEDEKRAKIADIMPKGQYLFPVGRLDKASRGLILLTNDNQFADGLLSTANKVEKIYEVQVKGAFNPEHLRDMQQGMVIAGEKYTAASVEILKSNPKTSWIRIELTEGKNREIRKMLQELNYEVLDLIRVQIGKLRLKDLRLNPGDYTQVSRTDIC